jgi:hypothetical protein
MKLQKKQYFEILNDLNLKEKDFNIFIETGSLVGDTIDEMKNVFSQVHSIELSKHYFNICSERFKNFDNVKLHNGDSSLLLGDVLKEINENVVFFLDGHWSGENTARGDKDCPLLEEIEIICNFFNYNSLIIIDDFRLFGTNMYENWKDITMENINKIILNTNFQTLPKNDRLIIFIKKN